MKKICLFLFMALLVLTNLKSQNIYDPYRLGSLLCPYEAEGPGEINGMFSQIVENAGPYDGEYQIFFDGDHPQSYWQDLMTTHAITYKIEVVSFPFTTNCFSCQGIQTLALNAAAGFGATDTSSDRTLRLPNAQFPYNPTENGWVRNLADPSFVASMTAVGAPPESSLSPGQTYEYTLTRVFEGEYPDGFGGSDPATLSSRGLTLSLPFEFHGENRIILPQTVLKHTFYIHCDTDPSSKIIDSFSFVLDHTRGRMNYYPFTTSFTVTAVEADHDIAIFPSIVMPYIWTNEPGFNNEELMAPGTVGSGNNTFNYFELPLINDACTNNYMPSYADINAGTIATTPGSFTPPTYIKIPPFSLVQAFLGNENGDGAVGFNSTFGLLPQRNKQTYIIDQPIDLTIINTTEKIIYNPSDAAIDLAAPSNQTGNKTLVFPSGYTFKTVSGLYPTAAQVQASDPQNLYYHKDEVPAATTLNVGCDDVGLADGIFAYYRVKSGSTLIIEPCVQLFDVIIDAEAGSNIYYNTREISGRNFYITNTGGGTLHDANTPEPAFSNCPFKCYATSQYDMVGNFNITTNKTWNLTSLGTLDASLDGKLKIGGTITVKSGNTLTITGPGKIEFGENGKFIVEKNARLILTGTVGNEVILTSAEACNNGMWQGIEVMGDPCLPQGTASAPSVNQGYLRTHFAIIENAHTAVRFGASNDATNNGGVLNTVLTTYRNNFVDIEINRYPACTTLTTSAYAAHIENCVFETTQQLNDPHYLTAVGRPIGGYKHIILNEVANVEFDANVFRNTAVDASAQPFFDAHVRGTGIYAFNTSLQLVDGISANTFQGLSDGVWATATNTAYLQIRGNHFAGNVRGIVLEGTNYSNIYTNDFLVPVSTTNPIIANGEFVSGYNKPVGIYLLGATNFSVQENTFTNYGPVSTASNPDEFNFGIVVNNCSGSTQPTNLVSPDGIGTGLVYKNQFSYTNVSLQAEQDNLGDGGGLEYKCNLFGSAVNYFVNVADVPPAVGFGSLPSLLRSQGICSLTPAPQNLHAGNLFGDCVDENQLRFETTTTSYMQPLPFDYSDLLYSLSCYTTIAGSVPDEPITPVYCAFSEGYNTCPSNLSKCRTIPCLVSAYDDARNSATEIKDGYVVLIDGGNTTALIAKINSSMSAGSLKSLLLSYSPYLSDAALMAMLNKTYPLPNGHIKQIILENSPVTAQVLDLLKSKGLPSGILESILAAQTGISGRAEKENEINYYAFQAKLAGVELAQVYLENNNLAGVKDVVDDDKSLAALYEVASIQIEMYDFASAKTTLNTIHMAEGLKPTSKSNILDIKLKLAQNNLTWSQASANQLKTIQNIYEINPQQEVHARVILANALGLQYNLKPYGSLKETSKHHVQNANALRENKTESTFTVYPNPAANQLNLNYQLNTSETGQFEMYDLLGAKLLTIALNNETTQKQLDISQLKPGVYLYVYKIKDKLVKAERFVIVK